MKTWTRKTPRLPATNASRTERPRKAPSEGFELPRHQIRSLELADKLFGMLRLKMRREVDIRGGRHDPIHRAGQRAGDKVGELELVQRIRHL